MSIMEELVQLERAIDQLARRWDRILAHEPGESMPTVAEIGALELRLRQLGLREAVSPVERGRLEQLASHMAVKAASWRRLASQGDRTPSAAPAPQKPKSPQPATPAAPEAERAETKVSPAMMEEYRRLFARYQAAMERAGETIPVNFGRFVQELEEQRQRLTARGIQVDGFDVVREASGVRVRPRTRAGRH
jgi:hypothetical protein